MKNIAVIGCGSWGQNHIRVFKSLQDSKVISVVDINQSRLEIISRKYPELDIESNYLKILENPDVDAVVIATPTKTHYRIVRDALIANKHVLCEKPFCETGVQAKELVETAKERNCILMVGHTFLFNPGIMKIKEILDEGRLETLYYLFAIRNNYGPVRHDVNVAYDLASHDISIFNWLIGREPESVSATGAAFLQPKVEDVVFISLKYPKNVYAGIQASWLFPIKTRQISIVGSQKILTWDDCVLDTPIAIYDKGDNAPKEYRDYREFQRVSLWEGHVQCPKVDAEEPLMLQNQHFMECIQGSFSKVRSDGIFGVEVVRTLEAISLSMQNNGAPICLQQ